MGSPIKITKKSFKKFDIFLISGKKTSRSLLSNEDIKNLFIFESLKITTFEIFFAIQSFFILFIQTLSS